MTSPEAHGGRPTLEELLDDARYEEAERLLALVLREEPIQPRLHALRALCLSQIRREDEALAAADRAIAVASRDSVGHWVRAGLLAERHRLDEAMASAQRAVALDPDDAAHHGLVAQIHALRGDWRETREAAERGLAIDPEDETCARARALSLRPTDSGEDWAASLPALLSRYPTSAWVRAAHGWTALERGQAADARGHFEQALALDPTSDWARDGLIEATKAENPFYAAILRFFLWLERLPPRTRWVYIIAGWLGFRYLSRSAASNPTLALIGYPFMAVWILFIVLSWTSGPLSDFALGRTRVGRSLVVGERRLGANLVAGILLIAVIAGAVGALVDSGIGMAAGLVFAFLVVPTAAIFRCSAGWPRNVMAAYTVLAAVAGIVGIVGPSSLRGPGLGLSIVMSVLGSWIGVFLASRTPAR